MNHTPVNQTQKFKIDLIVWKYVGLDDVTVSKNGFKIDLIVWKWS